VSPAEPAAAAQPCEALAAAPQQPHRANVVLRALRADLMTAGGLTSSSPSTAASSSSFRVPLFSMLSSGSRDMFCEIEWRSADGSRCERFTSRPSRKGHKHPVWNYECLQWTALDSLALDEVTFGVFMDSASCSCGWAKAGSALLAETTSVRLGDLLGVGDRSPATSTVGPVHELQLLRLGAPVGRIWVQAEANIQKFAPSVEWDLPVDPSCSVMLGYPASCAEEVGAVAVATSVAEPLSEPKPSLEAAQRQKRRRATSKRKPGGTRASASSMAASVMAALGATQAAIEDGEEEPAEPQRTDSGNIEISPTLLLTVRRVSSGYSGAAGEESPGCTSSPSGSPAYAKNRRRQLEFTRTDPERFELPVHRLCVSGGTAPFFRLLLREPEKAGLTQEYYLGKDLSHARDEVEFYESARKVMTASPRSSLSTLLGYTLEYGGVVTCPIEGASAEEASKELLVMRNLRDGCIKLRMLDIKIGEKTADANWLGKSRMAAMKQDILDGFTNSKGEGFRLEGFDSPGPALQSMNPLLDVLGVKAFNAREQKKAQRFMLQRMPATEVFMHFVDTHQEFADPGDGRLGEVRAPSEVAEIVLHEICARLAALSIACRQCTTPQKWVGSSIALGFDSGRLFSREVPEEDLRRAVRVNLFDWGRSELNTPEMHAEKPEGERQDRETFWCYYKGGIDRLAWEAARCYRHRFGSANGWLTAHVAVYDFDSLSDSDFIGRVSLSLRPTAGDTTVQLIGQHGETVRSRRGGAAATLTYRIAWRRFPEGSRLRGAWRVTIVRAEHLPGLDHFQGRSTSDPFAVVTAVSQDGRFRFWQQTCVVERQLNPIWDETFELTVAADPAALHYGFEAAAPGLGAPPLGPVLVHDDVEEDEINAALDAWSSRLDAAGAVALAASTAAAAAMRWEASWDTAPVNCDNTLRLPVQSRVTAALPCTSRQAKSMSLLAHFGSERTPRFAASLGSPVLSADTGAPCLTVSL